MYTRFIAVAVACMLSLSASTLFAQWGCGTVVTAYPPVVASYAAYYAPPVAYVAPQPYVSYYAPVTPYVSYYAPVVPYVSYYAPYAVAVRPYAAYYGVVGPSIYGTARLYRPGQPVRNVVRAVVP